MSKQPTASSKAIRKGRHQWRHWVGTPSDLAEVAMLAQGLVERETGGSRLTVIVTAPAFEATLTTAEEIRALTDEDLGDLAELSIEVDETPAGDTRRTPSAQESS